VDTVIPEASKASHETGFLAVFMS